MPRTPFITAFIALAILALPAAASAENGTCSSSGLTVTAPTTGVVGQPISYSYDFCYQERGGYYMVQDLQMTNAAGTGMELHVVPPEDFTLTEESGSVNSGGSFTPTAVGRYAVLIDYYPKNAPVWTMRGQAIINVTGAPAAAPKPAPVTPPSTTTNPTASPVGTASEASLSLTKHALKTLVKPGHNAFYVMTVKNTSSVTANKIVVCDAIPQKTQYVGATKPVTFYGSNACFTIGNLNAGAQASVTVELSVNRTAHGTITNHATATSTDAKTVKAQAKITVPTTPAHHIVAPVTG